MYRELKFKVEEEKRSLWRRGGAYGSNYTSFLLRKDAIQEI